MHRAVAVLSLLIVVAAGCGQEEQEQVRQEAREAYGQATEEAREAVKEATEAVGQLGDRAVRITSPGDGETVTGPVTLRVDVDGFRLIGADGDTSGRTGHLHAFIDREPTPAGEPIPTGQDDIVHFAQPTADLGDLAPGEHTVIVVAGDGAHVPFQPEVSDRVTFTVQ